VQSNGVELYVEETAAFFEICRLNAPKTVSTVAPLFCQRAPRLQGSPRVAKRVPHLDRSLSCGFYNPLFGEKDFSSVDPTSLPARPGMMDWPAFEEAAGPPPVDLSEVEQPCRPPPVLPVPPRRRLGPETARGSLFPFEVIVPSHT